MMRKIINNKMQFTLFCREFGNVVNHAFLVLIFWVKNSVGAIFSTFCNYASHHHHLQDQHHQKHGCAAAFVPTIHQQSDPLQGTKTRAGATHAVQLNSAIQSSADKMGLRHNVHSSMKWTCDIVMCVCECCGVAGAPNQALARTQLVKSPWAGTNIKNSSLAANNRHQKGSEN